VSGRDEPRDDEFASDVGNSSANSGSDDPEVLEQLQDQAEEGAAQGGKGRVE
jgi:hypothetical protein